MGIGFWLCSALALFGVYWVLGRPLLSREVLDDLGVKEILDDAGDIDGAAGLDESRMKVRNLTPLNLRLGPRLKKEKKSRRKVKLSILLRVRSPKMKRAKLLQGASAV